MMRVRDEDEYGTEGMGSVLIDTEQGEMAGGWGERLGNGYSRSVLEEERRKGGVGCEWSSWGMD
jgi:hypothetical protein